MWLSPVAPSSRRTHSVCATSTSEASPACGRQSGAWPPFSSLKGAPDVFAVGSYPSLSESPVSLPASQPERVLRLPRHATVETVQVLPSLPLQQGSPTPARTSACPVHNLGVRLH